MRFIPIDNVVPGSYLAKPVFNSKGTIMLKENCELTEGLLQRLKNHGYSGLYIDDEISKGIIIEDIIDEQMKFEIALCLEDLVKNNGDMVEIVPYINSIVETILSKDIVIEMNRLRNYHDYTYYHSVNVGILSISIGRRFHMTIEELVKLGTAAILHDIGKNDIPVEILDKPDDLTDEEYEIIKEHPQLGYRRVKDLIELSSVTKIGILQHHERCDGSGYPNGLKRNEITMFGKIIAVADTYDAMTTNRSYRMAYSPLEAYEYLLGDGDNRYDIRVVEKFTRCVSAYPVGTCVELSNGQEAIVVKNYVDNPLRPMVRDLENYETYDLNNDMKLLNVCINKIID